MVVKIRLARFGRRNAPFYNIVVAQARSARNAKPLEVLGTYDPIPRLPLAGTAPENAKPVKDIKIDVSRAKYWLGVGAQPSDTAWRLLSMIGLMEPRLHVQKMKQQQQQLLNPSANLDGVSDSGGVGGGNPAGKTLNLASSET